MSALSDLHEGYSIENQQPVVEAVFDKKLDEIIDVIAKGDIQTSKVKQLQVRFNQAVNQALTLKSDFDPFISLDRSSVDSRQELLDKFSALLAVHQVDSNLSKKYLKQKFINRVILSILGFFITIAGFAMMVLPAPAYFHLSALFYFNLSLLTILVGGYLLVKFAL